MAITIDWGSRVISVPQSFLTHTGGTNYSLDTNAFHIALKDLEDDEAGVAFPPTHNHNTSVLLGGIQYARIIEMINGYTITFENGVYAISLLGSNNNILDVTNLNQVAIRSNNSAGLINVSEIQHIAFNDGVTVDVTNGVAGTLYPIGTPLSPSNNIIDARAIAMARGFSVITILGGITLDTGDVLDGFIVRGKSVINTFAMINSGASVAGCQLEDMFIIDSVLDGMAYVKHAYLSNVSGVEGFLEGCILARNISFTGTQHTYFVDCKSACVGLGTTDLPVIDMSGSGRHIAFRNWSGPIKIINSTDPTNTICFDVVSGASVTVDSTCTAGALSIRGTANIVNTSAMTLNVLAQLDKTSIGAAVAQRTLDGGMTVEQSQRVVLAALAGKRSGIGTATENYYAVDGVTPRITLTPDAAGNGLPIINGAP